MKTQSNDVDLNNPDCLASLNNLAKEEFSSSNLWLFKYFEQSQLGLKTENGNIYVAGPATAADLLALRTYKNVLIKWLDDPSTADLSSIQIEPLPEELKSLGLRVYKNNFESYFLITEDEFQEAVEVFRLLQVQDSKTEK